MRESIKITLAVMLAFSISGTILASHVWKDDIATSDVVENLTSFSSAEKRVQALKYILDSDTGICYAVNVLGRIITNVDCKLVQYKIENAPVAQR